MPAKCSLICPWSSAYPRDSGVTSLFDSPRLVFLGSHQLISNHPPKFLEDFQTHLNVYQRLSHSLLHDPSALGSKFMSEFIQLKKTQRRKLQRQLSQSNTSCSFRAGFNVERGYIFYNNSLCWLLFHSTSHLLHILHFDYFYIFTPNMAITYV